MRNSKGDKKHFASSNHDTADFDFLRNAVPCIFRHYKKHVPLINSYNPNLQHTTKTQNTYQTLVTADYFQKPSQT
jgi:hypothetical protein